MRQLEAHLRNEYIPLGRQWMVLFPEGGFLSKRKPISQRFAAKNNLPVLQNVTVPRMGALFVIRDTLMGGSLSKETLQQLDKHIRDKKEQMPVNGGGSATFINNNNNNNGGHENQNQVAVDQQQQHKMMANGEDVNEPLNNNNNHINGSIQENIILQKELQDHPQLDYILDITIGYPDGKPLNLQNIVMGLREPCRTVLYYRVYSTRDVSQDLVLITL